MEEKKSKNVSPKALEAIALISALPQFVASGFVVDIIATIGFIIGFIGLIYWIVDTAKRQGESKDRWIALALFIASIVVRIILMNMRG